MYTCPYLPYTKRGCEGEEKLKQGVTKSHRNLRRIIKSSRWDLRRGGAPGVELLKDRDIGDSLG